MVFGHSSVAWLEMKVGKADARREEGAGEAVSFRGELEEASSGSKSERRGGVKGWGSTQPFISPR